MAKLAPISLPIGFKIPKVDVKGKTNKQIAAQKKAIVRGMQNGMNRIETKLSQLLDKAMESEVWGWNGNMTFRANGQAVTTPRNIVDTGALKKSKFTKLEFKQTVANLQFGYTSPYARFVHNGGMMQPYGKKNRTLIRIPGRPWVDAVMGTTPVAGVEVLQAKEILQAALKEAWDAQFG